MKRTLAAGVLTTTAAASLLAGTTADAVTTKLPGPGWTAAIQHQTSVEDDQGRLVMVRPTGGVVTVGEVSDDAEIQDVSTDGRYVLTSRHQDRQTRVTVWDTHTKKPTYFRANADYANFEFGGGGLVQMADRTTKTFIVRSLTGAVQNRYATANSGSNHPHATVTPNGKHVIEVKADDSIQVRDAASGTTVRTMSLPEKPTANRACEVARAWGNTSVGVDCQSTEGLDAHATYRVTFDGKVSSYGEFLGGWYPAPSGVVYDGPGGNGPTDWRLTTSAGEKALPFGQTAGVVGSKGNQVFALSSPSEGSRSELFTYDVTTGKRTVLAGTKATGGGVITDAQPIDGLQ